MNGDSYRKWNLDFGTMNKLYQLSRPILHEDKHRNSIKLLVHSKSLNVAIPGGPKFEPLFKDKINNPELEDFTEFNSVDRIIFRQPIKTEYKVELPFLYNSFVKKVSVSPLGAPLDCRSQQPQSKGLPAFTFNPKFNLIVPKTQPKKSEDKDDDDDDNNDFALDVEPFLSWTTTEETNDIEEFGEVPVEPKGTADALDLFLLHTLLIAAEAKPYVLRTPH